MHLPGNPFNFALPATVGRGINATLPEGLSASEETVEAITKCCAEFVSLVASEARDVRKSSLMTQQDVVTAIKKLGLESYLEGVEEDVEAEAKKAREKKRKRRPKQTKEEQEAAAKKQRELLKATEARFRIGQQLS